MTLGRAADSPVKSGQNENMFLGLPCVERHAKQNAEGLLDVRVTMVLAAAMADLSTERVHFRWTLEGIRRRKGPVRASQTRWYVAMQDAVAMTTGPRGFVRRFTSGSGATDGTIDSDGTRDGDGWQNPGAATSAHHRFLGGFPVGGSPHYDVTFGFADAKLTGVWTPSAPDGNQGAHLTVWAVLPLAGQCSWKALCHRMNCPPSFSQSATASRHTLLEAYF